MTHEEARRIIDQHVALRAAKEREAALRAALTAAVETLRRAAGSASTPGECLIYTRAADEAESAFKEPRCASCGGSKQERVAGRDGDEIVIPCSACQSAAWMPPARCRCGAVEIPHGWARHDGHTAEWAHSSYPGCDAAKETP